MEQVICYVAGRATGNLGPAAIGVHAVDVGGAVVLENAQSIGNASADFATFNAVMMALQLLVEHYGEEVHHIHFDIRLDNEVVKKQLNNECPITHPGLVPLFVAVHNLCVVSFPHLAVTLITESANAVVHRLVSEVLDGKEAHLVR